MRRRSVDTNQLTRAKFNLSSDEVRTLVLPRVPLRYIWEFLRDGDTPARVLNDTALRGLISAITGPGRIYELGGMGDEYKNFLPPDQSYVVTNVDPNYGEEYVDATKMPFEDNSVDVFISMFTLEHIYNYNAVIDEAYRSLKPGGRFLLAVPFMYYYHAAPDDYFRFTTSALDKMMSRYDILLRASFGNRPLLIAQLMHEKRSLGHRRSKIGKALLRLAATPALFAGLQGNQNVAKYAMNHLYIGEKPMS